MLTDSGLVRATLLVTAVVLVGGCLSGAPPAETASPTSSVSPTATTPAESPESTHACVEGVSFWGLSGPSPEERWDPDLVRIGYTLPPNASVHFVVYENDAALGSTHASNADTRYPIASDGDEIHLDSRLQGEHTIRVVAVADADRDGVFDPDVDTPCRENGEVVQAGPRTIDFSAFA